MICVEKDVSLLSNVHVRPDKITQSFDFLWESECSEVSGCALVESIDVMHPELVFKFFVLELKFGSAQVTDPNGQLGDLIILLCGQDGLVGDNVLQVSVHGGKCGKRVLCVAVWKGLMNESIPYLFKIGPYKIAACTRSWWLSSAWWVW